MINYTFLQAFILVKKLLAGIFASTLFAELGNRGRPGYCVTSNRIKISDCQKLSNYNKYEKRNILNFVKLLYIEGNSLKLDGPARGIVTKTVHKTLLRDGNAQVGRGDGVGVMESRGRVVGWRWWGSRGGGVGHSGHQGVVGWWGSIG